MPPSEPACAYAKIALKSHSADVQSLLVRIPGVRFKKGMYIVPFHALEPFDVILQGHGVQLQSAVWASPQPDTIPWDDVKGILEKGGEVRQEFIDEGYLMAYQKEALCVGAGRRGVHFWHPTGCLTGDTEISINRAGKGSRIKLRDLVHRFNGGSPGPAARPWDRAIPTMSQCFKDGHILLNKIHRAFSCGIKPVFLLRADGKTIKATAEHPFMLENGGWKKLGELKPGDRVRVRGVKKKPTKQSKNIYALVGVRHHPHASHVVHTLSPHKCAKGRYKPGHQVDVYRVPAHRLVVEASMNDISLEELIRRCREGGRALTGLTFLQPELHVHHANEDHRDNRLENLVVMAAQEHTAHHGNRTSWANVAIAAEISTVESIEPAGEEETFDLTMESPHNNYVANGFVVHNSGKTCSAILWSLLVPGPVIVITRAAARFQYAREWEKYTTCRPYVIRPASTMKKKSETFDQYLLSDEKRHVVVAAWESLQLYADKLVDMRPSAVIWDEAHLGKSSKRWESIPLPELPEDPKEAIKLALDQDAEARSRNGFISDNDGNRVMILPLDNTATAAARLARAAWRRCATTATPVKDRVRDLWAQLDIVEPDAWGSATCWLDRYCLVAETPVLMGDGTYRPVGDVQEGDEVIGWSRANGKRFLHRTKVIWTGTRQAEVVQLRMESGRKIICTRDHHWLQTRNPQVEKQYRSVFEEVGEADRTSRRKLKALQPLGAEPQDVSGLNTAAFKLGYLRGAVDGDGHTRIRKEKRLVLTGWGQKGRETRSGRKLPPRYYSVFFNAAERVHLERVVTYLRDLGMQTTGIKQKSDNMYVVGVHGKKSYRRIMCSRSSTAIGSFRRGWLSGMYDAEGSYDCISQYKDVNPDVYDYLEKSLTHFGFRTRLHEEGVFILGGRWEMLRFFDLVRPALSRKVDAVFARNPNFRFDVRAPDRILTAFPLKSPRTVVSIQTETGNYVAAGYGSKNCDRKPGTYGGYDTTGTSNLEELTGRLAKVTHHIAYTTTHRQLPPKRRQSVYVGAEDQIPPSAGFANELKKAQLRGATAVLEVKLAEAASRKRKAVLGIIEDHVYAGGKVVMFTGRRKDVDVLGELIRKSDAVKAKSAGVWAAHGENSSEERSNIVLEYMAHPGPCVLVGTGDSFGESLNMQDTDAALFVMLPYTPGQIRQWEGRFCRLGQKRPVTIYYVIAEGSVDEHVADILIRKLPAVEQVAKDEELAAAKDVIAGFDSQQSPDAFADKILAKIAKAAAQTESDDELDSEEDWE